MPPVQVTFTEVDQPWYATPDVWVAIGTVALAVITDFLAWYTYRLFKATTEARADSLEALEVAKHNAEATRIASEAAVRQAQLTAEQADVARETMIRTLQGQLVAEEVKVGDPRRDDTQLQQA